MKTVTPHTRFEDLPELLTIEEFMWYLRIGRSSAYEIARSGAIPVLKFGKLIRIPKAALTNWKAD